MIRNRIKELRLVRPDEVRPNAKNWRAHPQNQRDALRGVLAQVGIAAPVIAYETPEGLTLIDGHERMTVGVPFPCVILDVTEEEADVLLATFDPIGELATANQEKLAEILNDTAEKIQSEAVRQMLEHLQSKNGLIDYATTTIETIVDEHQRNRAGSLAERFGVPPFSVLDARQGYWVERKRAWIALGIRSGLGRGGMIRDKYKGIEIEQHAELRKKANKASTGGSPMPYLIDKKNGVIARGNFQGGRGSLDEENVPISGTSIFDPVLAELIYRWFTPEPGASILDPFAGGSVRGVVAATLGYRYVGIDLREEQIVENEKQADEIVPKNRPTWIIGDSRNIKDLAPGQYDLVFSCPPYGDLEVYSDDPRDLSTMDYDSFLKSYREIIRNSVAMLAPNRFACFVVGDIRDKRGFYRSFVAETIDAFQEAGMKLYNDAVLITSFGSLAVRIEKQFTGFRKLGKSHQNVLVFYQGEPKAIKEYQPIEFGSIREEAGGEDMIERDMIEL